MTAAAAPRTDQSGPSNELGQSSPFLDANGRFNADLNRDGKVEGLETFLQATMGRFDPQSTTVIGTDPKSMFVGLLKMLGMDEEGISRLGLNTGKPEPVTVQPALGAALAAAPSATTPGVGLSAPTPSGMG